MMYTKLYCVPQYDMMRCTMAQYDIHPFIHFLYPLAYELRTSGVSWGQSQQPLGEGMWTPRMSRQLITRPLTVLCTIIKYCII